MLEFRNLTSKEIECKAVVVGDNLIELSLHHNVSTCTMLLNEVVGPMNWEKEYSNNNKNCIVRIWDDEKKMMISKEDCGGKVTEVSGLKGQASNGFKRVCALGWGLGIELYSQPDIYFPITSENVVYDNMKKPIVVEQYYVKEIEYEGKKITHCVIARKGDNAIVYDGPNKDGLSNVPYPLPIEEEVIIPPNIDEQIEKEQQEPQEDSNKAFKEALAYINQNIINEKMSQNQIPKDLPNNTDGYEEDLLDTNLPFASINYREEIEKEMKRTNVRKKEVMNFLGIKTLNEIDMIDDTLLEEALGRLKAMATYKQ